MTLLLDGGVDAVKILPLARQLNLSRTSFYWFFRIGEELLAALVARWRDKNTGNLIRQTEAYAETIAEATLNVFDCWLDTICSIQNSNSPCAAGRCNPPTSWPRCRPPISNAWPHSPGCRTLRLYARERRRSRAHPLSRADRLYLDADPGRPRLALPTHPGLRQRSYRHRTRDAGTRPVFSRDTRRFSRHIVVMIKISCGTANHGAWELRIDAKSGGAHSWG